MKPCLRQEDIADILQAFEHSGFTRLQLIVGSVRVAANRAAAAAAPCADPHPETVDIVAPLLGIFQAGPEPGAPAFVQPGSWVEPDTTIGMIRVLRNLTAVKAGRRGRITEVLAQDGQLVEFGQTLLRVSTQSAGPGSDDLLSRNG